MEKVEALRTRECRRQGAGRELGLLEGAFSYRMVVPTLVKCLFRQPEWSIHYAAAESARIAEARMQLSAAARLSGTLTAITRYLS